jgi:hypothetical protein
MQDTSVSDRTFQVRAGYRDWARHRGAIALFIVLVGAGALVGWAAAWQGANGVRWACLALLICGIAGFVSLVACKFARGPQAALWTILIGMGTRMSAALAACLVVNSLWREGIDAGFGWYLVVAYLVTLTLDILYLAHSQHTSSADMHGVGQFGGPRGIPSTQGERHG